MGGTPAPSAGQQPGRLKDAAATLGARPEGLSREQLVEMASAGRRRARVWAALAETGVYAGLAVGPFMFFSVGFWVFAAAGLWSVLLLVSRGRNPGHAALGRAWLAVIGVAMAAAALVLAFTGPGAHVRATPDTAFMGAVQAAAPWTHHATYAIVYLASGMIGMWRGASLRASLLDGPTRVALWIMGFIAWAFIWVYQGVYGSAHGGAGYTWLLLALTLAGVFGMLLASWRTFQVELMEQSGWRPDSASGRWLAYAGGLFVVLLAAAGYLGALLQGPLAAAVDRLLDGFARAVAWVSGPIITWLANVLRPLVGAGYQKVIQNMMGHASENAPHQTLPTPSPPDLEWLGGLFALLVVAAAVYFVWRRLRHLDDDTATGKSGMLFERWDVLEQQADEHAQTASVSAASAEGRIRTVYRRWQAAAKRAGRGRAADRTAREHVAVAVPPGARHSGGLVQVYERARYGGRVDVDDARHAEAELRLAQRELREAVPPRHGGEGGTDTPATPPARARGAPPPPPVDRT